MRDAIGNKLLEDSIVVWHLPKVLDKLVLRVTRVHDGGLPIGTTGEFTEPTLTLSIDVPIGNVKPGAEAQLGDFMCLRDPRSEELLAKVTTGRTQ